MSKYSKSDAWAMFSNFMAPNRVVHSNQGSIEAARNNARLIAYSIGRSAMEISDRIEVQTDELKNSLIGCTALQILSSRKDTEELAVVIESSTAQMTNQLSSRIEELQGCLNQRLSTLISNSSVTNFWLENIAELLAKSDAEKRRSYLIDRGLKLSEMALEDPELAGLALEAFMEAEALEKNDPFLLHSIGWFHLNEPKCIDLEVAVAYFERASRLAIAEMRMLQKSLTLSTDGLNDSTGQKSVGQLAALQVVGERSLLGLCMAHRALRAHDASAEAARRARGLFNQSPAPALELIRSLVLAQKSSEAADALAWAIVCLPDLLLVIQNDDLLLQVPEIQRILQHEASARGAGDLQIALAKGDTKQEAKIRLQPILSRISKLHFPDGATFLKSLVDSHFAASAELSSESISEDRVASILHGFLDCWDTPIRKIDWNEWIPALSETPEYKSDHWECGEYPKNIKFISKITRSGLLICIDEKSFIRCIDLPTGNSDSPILSRIHYFQWSYGEYLSGVNSNPRGHVRVVIDSSEHHLALVSAGLSNGGETIPIKIDIFRLRPHAKAVASIDNVTYIKEFSFYFKSNEAITRGPKGYSFLKTLHVEFCPDQTTLAIGFSGYQAVLFDLQPYLVQPNGKSEFESLCLKDVSKRPLSDEEIRAHGITKGLLPPSELNTLISNMNKNRAESGPIYDAFPLTQGHRRYFQLGAGAVWEDGFIKRLNGKREPDAIEKMTLLEYLEAYLPTISSRYAAEKNQC